MQTVAPEWPARRTGRWSWGHDVAVGPANSGWHSAHRLGVPPSRRLTCCPDFRHFALLMGGGDVPYHSVSYRDLAAQKWTALGQIMCHMADILIFSDVISDARPLLQGNCSTPIILQVGARPAPVGPAPLGCMPVASPCRAAHRVADTSLSTPQAGAACWAVGRPYGVHPGSKVHAPLGFMAQLS